LDIREVRSAGGNNADGPNGRRRSVEDPRRRLYQPTQARRNLGAVGLAWFLAATAAVMGYWILGPKLRDPLDSDFTLVYIAVRIGLEHGWDHIYSLSLQRQLFEQLRPGVFFNDGQRYLAPPPLAWLTLLLSPLGAAGAFFGWLVISVAALVAAWWLGAPPAGRVRFLWLLAAIAWYPVLYSLSYGQPALLVLLSVVGCWWLAEHGRPYLAGVALAAGMSLKPQLLLAVPLVLLVAGRWRVIVGWAAVLALLTIASLLTLGPNGLQDYRSLLAEAQTVVNNRFFTLAYVLGPGAAGYAAQGIVLVAVAAAAYVNRAASNARLIALALVATAFGATYWHVQDFTILLAAVWLFWRDHPPAWQRAWLLVVALTIELAWALRPIPLLIAVGVWLAYLSIPARAQPARETSAPA
jgi:hypothetical protein